MRQYLLHFIFLEGINCGLQVSGVDRSLQIKLVVIVGVPALVEYHAKLTFEVLFEPGRVVYIDFLVVLVVLEDVEAWVDFALDEVAGRYQVENRVDATHDFPFVLLLWA